MGLDFLQAHFFHQAILVCAVISFDSAFCLRRIGRRVANPQPLAHLTKLRHRHHPLQLFFPARFSNVHVLPIRIQRRRNTVFLDPSSQHSRRGPDRLLTPQARQRISAGIVHHVHQAATRTSSLQPLVKASIHLHQFPHMLFPFSPLAVHTPLPRSTP